MRRSIATSAVIAALGIFAPAIPSSASAGAVQHPARAYVLHATSSLTAIDTSTRAVAGAVAVGAGPSQIAFATDGTRAYVSMTATDSVAVIDTATDGVLSTIPVGDGPAALAVSPRGTRLYVMLAGGLVQVVNTSTGAIVGAIDIGAGGDIAVTPDGTRLYVAAGRVYVVDLASDTVATSFPPTPTASAMKIAIAPDGRSAYVTAHDIFTGTVVRVDLASNTVAQVLGFVSIPGDIAIAPDGERVYVGRAATFVDTGYGEGFFPGRSVAVLDTRSNTWIGEIDLGATGPNWTEQNTASGIAVTPDRGAVYISVPRLAKVAVADFNTNSVVAEIPTPAGPGELGIVPDSSAAIVPYRVDAVDDAALSTTLGGPAVANVLANDTFGGAAAAATRVSLAQISTTDPGITLDTASGAVDVAAGLPIGRHVVAYRICEIDMPANCDAAEVMIALRASYAIDAVADNATTLAARQALSSVLDNDTLNGVAATTATVVLSQVSTSTPGIALNPANGSVFVYAGTRAGGYSLRYRMCEIESPVNCDETDVAITVLANPIDAADDSGQTTRSGGIAVANVLGNDSLTGAEATPANVTLSRVSSTSSKVALDRATGRVTVAPDTAIGTYVVVYRICEALVGSNCDKGTATVRVGPYLIDAVNDTVARASSKTPATLVPNVLVNDRFAAAAATLANVTLAQVSTTNPDVKLAPKTGAVKLLRRTSSETVTLVYRICERRNDSNCDTATVVIHLSGGTG